MKKMMVTATMLLMLLGVSFCAGALECSDVIVVNGETMTVAQALTTSKYLTLDMYDKEACEIMLAVNAACGENAMNELAFTGKWSERVYWLEQAAQAGNGFAMYLLWQEYWDVDNEKAIAYLRQAADAGIHHAQYDLATAYLWGEIGSRWDSISFEKDRAKGEHLMTLAAEGGVTEAMYFVGLRYEHGNEKTPMDKQKAAAWYLRTREQGAYIALEYLYAIEHLAQMCEAGEGIERNDELAFELYKEANEHPMNHSCLYGTWDPELASMYAEGRGTKQDIERAWDMLEEMREYCEGYDITWTYTMGMMYERGYGVEKNLEMAEHYYEEAIRLEIEEELACMD